MWFLKSCEDANALLFLQRLWSHWKLISPICAPVVHFLLCQVVNIFSINLSNRKKRSWLSKQCWDEARGEAAIENKSGAHQQIAATCQLQPRKHSPVLSWSIPHEGGIVWSPNSALKSAFFSTFKSAFAQKSAQKSAI